MYCDCPHLGRCCFCLPLRRGVLIFGYLNVFFCAFMIGLYSHSLHYAWNITPIFHGALSNTSTEFCLALYCVELVFNIILIYGAHRKLTPYIKAFYYFSITTLVGALLIQILDVNSYEYFGMVIEMAIFTFTGMCIQLYLIALVRSLLRNLEMDGPHLYDNPLQQIVTGETRIESNGIYNNTTVEPVNL